MIGRDASCALRIPDGRISRRHLQIAYDRRRHRHLALDIGSANGVTVNGRRLVRGSERPLDDGDEIHIGRTRLRYALSGSDVGSDEGYDGGPDDFPKGPTWPNDGRSRG